MNYQILLLGARGFIGSRIANFLRKQSLKYSVVSRFSETNSYDYSIINWKDFIDASFINYFKPENVIIINCIGEVRNEEEMINVNINLVKTLIQLNITYKFRKIIHLGSAGIYKKSGVISYNSTISPTNFYEWTKFVADELLLNNDIYNNIQIIRPTTVVGENMINKSFYKLLSVYNSVGFISVSNPQKTYFHFLSVEVLINIIISCINNELNEKIYLVSTDVTQKEFCYCFPRKLKRIYIPNIILIVLFYLKIPGLTRARIQHLRDEYYFVSNIENLNNIKLKMDYLSRTIKGLNII
jgi:nucleoside-diphosphate-sugar epimerase